MPTTEQQNTTSPATPKPAANSILAQLRERRAVLQQERKHDAPLPRPFADMLVARYRPVAWERLREIAITAEKVFKDNPRKELFVYADTLVAACEAVFYKQNDGSLTPLTAKLLGLSDDDTPMGYEPRLAKALDLDGADEMNSRQVVFALFPDPLAITVQYTDLMEWQGEGDEAVDEELVGEAPAAR